ncbi:MAG: hypothetical protein CMM25_01345 [Rhodospirillaceae bacterium]|nr:hypothetical protein [Rhodospirillaceae bacterium]|tara:strand:+ start:475 stop:1398 length:924 start_codon:yes stop_codon:yes gene_type:complete
MPRDSVHPDERGPDEQKAQAKSRRQRALAIQNKRDEQAAAKASVAARVDKHYVPAGKPVDAAGAQARLRDVATGATPGQPRPRIVDGILSPPPPPRRTEPPEGAGGEDDPEPVVDVVEDDDDDDDDDEGDSTYVPSSSRSSSSRRSRRSGGRKKDGGMMDPMMMAMMMPMMMNGGGGMRGSPVNNEEMKQLEEERKETEAAIKKLIGLMESLKELQGKIKEQKKAKSSGCDKGTQEMAEAADAIRQSDVIEALNKCRKTLKKYKDYLGKLHIYSVYLQRLTTKIQKRMKYNIKKTARVCGKKNKGSK